MKLKTYLKKQEFIEVDDNSYANEYCNVVERDNEFEIANNDGVLLWYGTDLKLLKKEIGRLRRWYYS